MNYEFPVPTLLGGTSQQDKTIRRPDQWTECINAYPNLVDGLQKRPPTEHVARTLSGTGASYDAYIHTYNRGDGNVFNILVTNTGITAFNATGGTINVIDETNGYAYLTGATASEDFRLVTVQDYTFVLNKSRTPAMNTGRTAPAPYGTEGFVYARGGHYKTTYTLQAKLDGANASGASVSVSTWDGVAAQAGELSTRDLNTICSGLFQQATGAFVSGATPWFNYDAPLGGVFRFYRTPDDLAYFRPTDGGGNIALSVIQNGIRNEQAETNSERISSLPDICRNGFKLSVDGESESTTDNYYLIFTGDTATGLSRGDWEETIAYDSKYGIDAATMPHQLVLEPTGSTYHFRYRIGSWDDRYVGDENSNPDPSFIGRPIRDVFFFQDRLGVVAEDRIVMSEQGNYFNFFRTTMRSLPDTERIDTQVSHNRVVNLNHVVPFNRSLLLFSDLGQFLLDGEEAVTNKTISVTPVSEFENSETVRPALAGRSVYFAYTNGDYSGVRELFPATDLDSSFDAQSVTLGIPQYIKGSVIAMAVNTLEDVMAVLTDDEQQTVYIYKYLWNGNDKVLSYWGKWTFGAPETDPNIKVYHMAWVETDLYIVIKRKDGIYLEKLRLAPGAVDSGSEFVTLLDRRIDQASCSLSYTESTNQTVITLPYMLNAATEVKVIGKDGKRWEVKSQGTYSVNVRGDARNSAFWVGESYSMTLTATPPVVKYRTESGYSPAGQGSQKARKAMLFFKNSRFIKATVQVENRQAYTYSFLGPSLGDINAVLGEVPVSSGSLKIPLMGTSEKVALTIINDSPYPSNLVSMTYTINFNPRAARWTQ